MNLQDRLIVATLNKLQENKNNETNNLELYWDAQEIKRDLFFTLLKFNFGYDANYNNYLITLDGVDKKRFNASSDEEAIKIYDQFRKDWNNSDHVNNDIKIDKIVEESNDINYLKELGIIEIYTDDITKAVIAKLPNGKFKNYYFDDKDDLDHFTSYAGNFDTLQDAQTMIKNHRPNFRKI